MIDIVSHRVADIVINDEGRINGSPVNVRISHWVLHDSAMAKEAGNIRQTGRNHHPRVGGRAPRAPLQNPLPAHHEKDPLLRNGPLIGFCDKRI